MNKGKTQMIVDTIWLVIIFISIVVATKHNSMQYLVHCISLMIWYIGAAYLSSTWEK